VPHQKFPGSSEGSLSAW